MSVALVSVAGETAEKVHRNEFWKRIFAPLLWVEQLVLISSK